MKTIKRIYIFINFTRRKKEKKEKITETKFAFQVLKGPV
jgi:hypothetical protein